MRGRGHYDLRGHYAHRRHARRNDRSGRSQRRWTGRLSNRHGESDPSIITIGRSQGSDGAGRTRTARYGQAGHSSRGRSTTLVPPRALFCLWRVRALRPSVPTAPTSGANPTGDGKLRGSTRSGLPPSRGPLANPKEGREGVEAPRTTRAATSITLDDGSTTLASTAPSTRRDRAARPLPARQGAAPRRTQAATRSPLATSAPRREAPRAPRHGGVGGTVVEVQGESSRPYQPGMYLPGKVAGAAINLLIDTGSTTNLISKKIFDRLPTSLQETLTQEGKGVRTIPCGQESQRMTAEHG